MDAGIRRDPRPVPRRDPRAIVVRSPPRPCRWSPVESLCFTTVAWCEGYPFAAAAFLKSPCPFVISTCSP
uniref:Uncharacterized protein n=1 Tax=Zea mays TaxID=4577 RepID=C0P5X7_MAIZE|nr:unknown [Zea mays]